MRQCSCLNSTLGRRQGRSNEICLEVADVSNGSKPEKPNASRCFPLCTLEADIAQCSRHVCFVPEAVIIRARLMPYIDLTFSC